MRSNWANVQCLPARKAMPSGQGFFIVVAFAEGGEPLFCGAAEGVDEVVEEA